tara:strand:+ start:120 stop:554 length:435 start_codon:yes stop_codon:yes gene_type:complete
MKMISHRGNVRGMIKESENNPTYINAAISDGYDVEIDVWKTIDGLFLGHDCPQYGIDKEYLKNDRFWCHAKNIEALEFMLKNNIRCFWHQEDEYTLTSDGVIWTYPMKDTTKTSVIVCRTLEESVKQSKANVYGICSDFIGEIK